MAARPSDSRWRDSSSRFGLSKSNDAVSRCDDRVSATLGCGLRGFFSFWPLSALTHVVWARDARVAHGGTGAVRRSHSSAGRSCDRLQLATRLIDRHVVAVAPGVDVPMTDVSVTLGRQTVSGRVDADCHVDNRAAPGNTRAPTGSLNRPTAPGCRGRSNRYWSDHCQPRDPRRRSDR